MCIRDSMKVMPLHIIYPEKDYVDGVDIFPETIYQRFPKEIPSTSTPSPQDVKNMVEEMKAEGYTCLLYTSKYTAVYGKSLRRSACWSFPTIRALPAESRDPY